MGQRPAEAGDCVAGSEDARSSASADERDRSRGGLCDPASGGVHTVGKVAVRKPNEDVGDILSGGEHAGWAARNEHRLTDDTAHALDSK